MTGDQHICGVCFLPSSQHNEECGECEGSHWPPLCCEGCPCGTAEAAHAHIQEGR